jgi:hypothetical protein
MPRSTTIYTVMTTWGSKVHPIAAFTVQHELATWLESCGEETRSQMVIWRIQDSGWRTGAPAQVTYPDDYIGE